RRRAARDDAAGADMWSQRHAEVVRALDLPLTTRMRLSQPACLRSRFRSTHRSDTQAPLFRERSRFSRAHSTRSMCARTKPLATHLQVRPDYSSVVMYRLSTLKVRTLLCATHQEIG